MKGKQLTLQDVLLLRTSLWTQVALSLDISGEKITTRLGRSQSFESLSGFTMPEIQTYMHACAFALHYLHVQDS